MQYTTGSRLTGPETVNSLKFVTLRWSALVFLHLSVAAFPASLRGETLQAGIATIDITPPVPYRMGGQFYQRLSTGIKDPLRYCRLPMGTSRLVRTRQDRQEETRRTFSNHLIESHFNTKQHKASKWNPSLK